MRILVLGEGPNDLGRVDRDGLLTFPGVLPILIERLCLEFAPSLLLEFQVLPWKSGSLRPHKGSGFHKRLEIAAGRFAGKVDVIVGVVDRDGVKNRSRADQLRIGREAVLSHNFSCAVGLSVETLEATLLADETALRHRPGRRLDYLSTRSRKPRVARRAKRQQSQRPAAAADLRFARWAAWPRLHWRLRRDR